MASVSVLVATHKEYRFPNRALYPAIEVGSKLREEHLEYLRDDSGENISEKNPFFSELTALYWAWKNHFFKDVAYCGLVHYRRYFKGKMHFGKSQIMDEQNILEIMAEYDMIMPRKRNYYIETVRSHYEHAHYKKDLDILEKVISELASEYMDSFHKVMEQRSLYLYNMFIMRTEQFEAYCAWLFPLLFETERRLNITGYDTYQKRVYGFMAERLFNVWLCHHQLKVKEVKVVNLEGENLILKAVNMLKRKYLK